MVGARGVARNSYFKFCLGPVGRINAFCSLWFFRRFYHKIANSFLVCPKLTRALSGHASPGLASFLAF
jgi:hypothetical protein